MRTTRLQAAKVAFVAPAVLVVVALLVYPVLSSLYWSVTNRNLIRQSYSFVGLDNFTDLLTSPTYWSAFLTSIKWTVGSLVLQLGLGMGFALALNALNRGSALYRVLLIVPWAFPPIILAFAWKWILNDVYGFLPNVLQITGVTERRISLLSDPILTFWVVLAINVWFGAPLFMVNILSALKTIPAEQYEAAVVDGAGPWRSFTHITLHHIRQVIGLLVILRTIWVFNNFDIVYLLTGGGPGDLTTTLPIYAYQIGWSLRQLGMASAITVLLLLFLLAVAAGMFTLLNRWERQELR